MSSKNIIYGDKSDSKNIVNKQPETKVVENIVPVKSKPIVKLVNSDSVNVRIDEKYSGVLSGDEKIVKILTDNHIYDDLSIPRGKLKIMMIKGVDMPTAIKISRAIKKLDRRVNK